MEIVLWFIAIVLGLFLLKFLFSFIIRIIGLGIWLAITSMVICALLVLFDVMEWSTCCTVSGWAFWIGTAVGGIIFIKEPIQTIKDAFDLMDDNNVSSKNTYPEKKSYSFYDENNHYVTVVKCSEYNEYDFYDPVSGVRYEKIPGEIRFIRKS